MNKKTIIFGSIACVVLAIGAVLFFNTPTGGTAGDGAIFTTQSSDRPSESAEGHRFSIETSTDRNGKDITVHRMDGEIIPKRLWHWYFKRQ